MQRIIKKIMVNFYDDLIAMFLFYRSQVTHISKSTTGCKESYSLQKLEFHNPIKQTVPDTMHTIKDAIEHYFYLIVGRDDSVKVIAAKAKPKRFGLSTRDSNAGKIDMSLMPYIINRAQQKTANIRATSIICPHHVDFKPRPFLMKTQPNSHDWKQANYLA